jgi:hypothetical protein
MGNEDASCIECPCPKILGQHALSLVALSNFFNPPSARPLVTLDTTVLPPPPAVLDPGPEARHHLVLGLGSHCHLNPSVEARHHLITDPEHGVVNHKHVTCHP